MEEFKKVTIINNESKQIVNIYFIKPEEIDPWLDKKVVENSWGQVEDYEIIIENTTLEKMQSLSYLYQTDWYVLREIDEGVPTPAEIKQKRAEARETLEDELLNIKGVLLDQVVGEST